MNPKLPRVVVAEDVAVETRGLTRSFGPVRAVDSLDLTVPEGEVYLLIGPNGSGKTSTFRMLLGLLRPDHGEAHVLGRRCGPDGGARSVVGFVPETRGSGYDWLRVADLIDLHRRYRPTWDAAYAATMQRTLDIPMGQRFATLSKGEARRVQLLVALAHRPPVLLLDEPTDGLDPVGREIVFGTLTEHLATTPTTIVVATHLVYELERLATYLGVLNQGRLVAQLDRDSLRSRLRLYTLEVAEHWEWPADGLQVVSREERTGRRRRWVVWGREPVVRAELEAAGASVRSVRPLSLNEAAVALLGGGAASEPDSPGGRE